MLQEKDQLNGLYTNTQIPKAPYNRAIIQFYSLSGSFLYSCRGQEISRENLVKHLNEKEVFVYQIIDKDRILKTGKLNL